MGGKLAGWQLVWPCRFFDFLFQRRAANTFLSQKFLDFPVVNKIPPLTDSLVVRLIQIATPSIYTTPKIRWKWSTPYSSGCFWHLPLRGRSFMTSAISKHFKQNNIKCQRNYLSQMAGLGWGRVGSGVYDKLSEMGLVYTALVLLQIMTWWVGGVMWGAVVV